MDRLAQVDWLAVKIRQRRPGTDAKWLAEGTLQRGPNGCSRLTMSYRSGASETHSSEMISDGRVLAQVIHRPGKEPGNRQLGVVGIHGKREELLDKYGCGGPYALLRHLAGRVATWQLGHVRQGDRVLVQTTGEFVDQPDKVTAQRRVVRLSFDAATFWLERVEWWSDQPESGGRLLWNQEYLEPRIGEALSLE